jgi:hypothetical protein
MLAIVQLAALIGWRRWSGWLLIVAGARLSDVLPDVFYLAGSPARTISTWGLLGAPVINLAFAWFLVVAWRANSPRGELSRKDPRIGADADARTI